MKKHFLVLSILSLSFVNSFGQYLIQWQNTIGGGDSDWLFSIQQTTDEGFILCGWSISNISGDKTENSQGVDDYWIVKLDAVGNIEWQNTIGGSGLERYPSIQQTSDEGYILGGWSDSDMSGDKTENSQGGQDYWVVKLDSIGNIQWQNTIGGSSDDILYSIKQTLDEGYILGGWSRSDSMGDKTENSQGDHDYWVIKLDALGNIQWQNTIGGSTVDYLLSAYETPDNGYVLGGYSASNISGDKTENSLGNMGTMDYWIVKLDSLGTIQWQNTIGGNSQDVLFTLNLASDGGYVLAGYSSSNISGDKAENCYGVEDYWVVKIDPLGNIQWQKTLGGDGWDWLYSIEQTADGGYILGGASASNSSGNKTENSMGFMDYWVVKLIEEGTTQIEGANYSIQSIQLFPNPVTEVFSIRSEQEFTSLRITNILGEEVFTETFLPKKEMEITVSQLAIGIYFLQAETAGIMQVQKFVKE